MRLVWLTFAVLLTASTILPVGAADKVRGKGFIDCQSSDPSPSCVLCDLNILMEARVLDFVWSCPPAANSEQESPLLP